MEIDFTAIAASCEAHWKLGNRCGIPRNFLQVSDTLAAKFTDLSERESLEREYGWLEYCRPLVDLKLVVVPQPRGPLITYGQLIILIMDFIGGQAVEDRLKDKRKLSDGDASRIVDAYLALRQAITPKGDKLCPTGSWYLQGHIFKPFGDGGLTKSSYTELKAYMEDRLTQACDGNKVVLPQDERVWIHGDLSPSNIKLLSDGRVAILDLGVAFFGPSDWEAFALRVSGYEVEFVLPMVRAFDRKGLGLREDRQAMYETFMYWHAQKGCSVAR